MIPKCNKFVKFIRASGPMTRCLYGLGHRVLAAQFLGVSRGSSGFLGVPRGFPGVPRGFPDFPRGSSGFLTETEVTHHYHHRY
jgi:hypothetical protein